MPRPCRDERFLWGSEGRGFCFFFFFFSKKLWELCRCLFFSLLHQQKDNKRNKHTLGPKNWDKNRLYKSNTRFFS